MSPTIILVFCPRHLGLWLNKQNPAGDSSLFAEEAKSKVWAVIQLIVSGQSIGRGVQGRGSRNLNADSLFDYTLSCSGPSETIRAWERTATRKL